MTDDGYGQSLQEIFKMNNDKAIHNKTQNVFRRNLQIPSWFVYIYNEWYFKVKQNDYNLRDVHGPYSSNGKTLNFGTELMTYRGFQILNLIPDCPSILINHPYKSSKMKSKNEKVKKVYVRFVKPTSKTSMLSKDKC